QTLAEGGRARWVRLSLPAVEPADQRHRRLLPARRERPHRRAAEQRDNIATSIELHRLPQPGYPSQHTALMRIESGALLRCEISTELSAALGQEPKNSI